MNTQYNGTDRLLIKIVYTGLMTALVLIATLFFKVPVPFTNGYVHLGDSMIFVAAILLGWKGGAFAAGVGSALADILGGYPHWALPTLIIKILMGAIIGLCVSQKNRKGMYTLLGVIFAGSFAGFNGFLHYILTKDVKNASKVSDFVLQELEVSSHGELLQLTDKVQMQLLVVTLLIPLSILLTSFIIAKYNHIKFRPSYTFSFVIAGTIMVFGYYIAYYLMIGNYIIPIFSIPWNVVQFVVGLLIAEIVIAGLRKAKAIQ
ncbi:ECF transporter S component [Vallitalea pronyensis]|uniref:ECF transporter S component n=1 Tax=Vallitalea pronyensis TaxID=1348613 RepID=A0A8J8MND2_9FIRM|nr:ECF transporter S component [Vallitalea pronyensis]QUI24408.1 ECF transporter S component [Vallitalea pronyensis]